LGEHKKAIKIALSIVKQHKQEIEERHSAVILGKLANELS
jgi:hypothetical protein